MKFTYEDLLKFAEKNCRFTQDPLFDNRRSSAASDGQQTPAIYIDWVTGGITGGSCWKGSEPHPQQPEEKPNFDSLDDIIERFYPNITYIQFKKIEKLIKVTERDSRGYYGNYDEIRRNYIVLKELYETLRKINRDSMLCIKRKY